MISPAALPVTAETRDKLYALALMLAMRTRRKGRDVQEILDQEWQRIEAEWARKG
jgi:hypothetical protein